MRLTRRIWSGQKSHDAGRHQPGRGLAISNLENMMAENTKIAWCDSTFNPWIGCTRVGPGCDHCYAEVQDSRKRWGGTTHWGAGVERYRTSASNWAKPIAWNREAATTSKAWRVFCASLADVFDNEVDPFWRRDLFRLIDKTPALSWLLVTKRIGNVRGMMPSAWVSEGFPSNVRLLITVCNQAEADRDIPKLLALPCKNGISYEPALGPVKFGNILDSTIDPPARYSALRGILGMGRALGWVIIGGESGPRARLFDVWWARDTIKQCKAAGVPVFIKQLGAGVGFRNSPWELSGRPGDRPKYPWDDPTEWPEDLRVQEFPT